MISVGIIGAGSISEYHIRALRQAGGIEVVAITDVNETRAGEDICRSPSGDGLEIMRIVDALYLSVSEDREIPVER